MAGTEVYVDGQGRRQTRKTSDAGDVAAAEAAEKHGTTAGKGLGSMGKGFTPPKQEPGEDSGSYSRRVARDRAAHNAGDTATGLAKATKRSGY